MPKTPRPRRKYTTKRKTRRNKRGFFTRHSHRRRRLAHFGHKRDGNHEVPTTIVGLIHMNGCGACVGMMPAWDEFATMARPPINLVKIEAAEFTDHKLSKILPGNKVNVTVDKGYPTIFKIKNGVATYYDSERKAENLLKWAKE